MGVFNKVTSFASDLLGGGENRQSATNQTVSEPPSWQIPYIQEVLSGAQNIYQNPSQWPQYYPGQQIAGLNPNITGSWDMATQQGVPYAQHAGNLGMDALGQAVQGANPLNNPFFYGT
ncbi:MAG: hypothetical protein ACWGQW_05465, partial [bacterium]